MGTATLIQEYARAKSDQQTRFVDPSVSFVALLLFSFYPHRFFAHTFQSYLANGKSLDNPPVSFFLLKSLFSSPLRIIVTVIVSVIFVAVLVAYLVRCCRERRIKGLIGEKPMYAEI